jgi:PHD/YefM family antitoxin component YafN of YafNO toxin-antitoxin module
MIKLKERYIVDRDGTKSAVILDIAEFEEVMKKLEEYEGDYDTEDVTGDIIAALKDIKAGKTLPARELLNEL